MKASHFHHLYLLAFALWLPVSVDAQVRAVEESVTLPTYIAAAADPHPRFYSGRTYQGARATFYPYPVSDQMTERREDRTYKAVVLENDFIRFSVLPEIGGRIFTAEDKGNGYDFFYRQHVIKPALIGMLGAWISGGVEWNVPHHHRASSFMPVDYTLSKEPDGGATVWVGETELRHRMKWLVGMTLRPDRSYIEMTVRLFNRTPAAQSFLFWINPAVHANEQYQVIFPPSTQWTVQHGKPEFASWPIARQVYGGQDYTAGVDISWWKNHRSPVSFFAWDCREDFFGGYDHGREAGVAQISNHHVSPGKKFFEWGNGAEGEMWTKILSDADGPYLELMAGSFSDNQPDYSWLAPGEVKEFKHFWYPIRELGGIKQANTEAALNLELNASQAELRVNSTANHPAGQVRLWAADRLLFEETVAIGPKQPFKRDVPVPEGVQLASLRAMLLDESGKELIAYQPKLPSTAERPKPVDRPRPPRDIASLEELYYTGLRIEQLYSPSFDPEPYYREALSRDSGDYRANTAMGALYCRQGRWAEAETFLRAAITRSTANYIRPKDCEAQYYLGVALRGQGKEDLAWDEFYRAIWDQAWKPAGFTALAELASRRNSWATALDLAEQALQYGALNTRAAELKVSTLRRLGRLAEASQAADALLQIDPLNARAWNERRLLAIARSQTPEALESDLLRALRNEGTAFLELAMSYANGGLNDEAIGILQLQLRAAPNSPVSPLTHYCLAWLLAAQGKNEVAGLHLDAAPKLPVDYCFPFQHEAEAPLLHAIAARPNDSRAPYYLGCLLYDTQPERALGLWQQAVRLDPDFPAAHRALANGLAQTHKDLATAIPLLERALDLNPNDSRWYYELDVLYEAAGASVNRRLERLDRNPAALERRDDAITRRIQLLIVSDRADEALQLLLSRQFHNWEGSSALHQVHVDACIRQGLHRLQSGDAEGALNSFRAALDYPENQQVGAPAEERLSSVMQYLAGAAHARANPPEPGNERFAAAASAPNSWGAENRFFKGLALRRLGKDKEAEEIFQQLERTGLQQVESETDAPDYFAKFGEKRPERVRQAQAWYTAALGSLGLGEETAAKQHFEQALRLDPGHLGARMWGSAAEGATKPAWWMPPARKKSDGI